jgi:hypothetical protein
LFCWISSRLRGWRRIQEAEKPGIEALQKETKKI